MRIRWAQFVLFLELLMTFASAIKERNSFISQYFIYKNVAFVIGFSCEHAKGNAKLMRNLGKNYIYSTIVRLHPNLNVKTYLGTKYRNIGVFFDLRCENNFQLADSLFKKASKANMYQLQHTWLIIGDELQRILKILDDSEYSITTDLILAIEYSQGFLLYDAYNHCKYRGGKLIITFFGSWNHKTNQLDVRLNESKFERRQDMQGIVLRVATLLTDKPKNMPIKEFLLDFSTKQADTMAKFVYACWTVICEMFNFTLEVEQISVWNASNKNGPIIKKLFARGAELPGITGIITPDRISNLCSIPIWPFRTCFIFRTAPAKIIKINHFLRPLSSGSWYCTVIILVILCITFSWILVVEYQNHHLEHYSAAVVTILGCLCQQSFLQAMIFSFLIYTYYSGSIVSARLSEPVEKINDSLNELAKTNLKFAAEPSLSFNTYIKRPDWEIQQFYNNRWIHIPEKERFIKPYDGMMRVLRGDYAYHTDVNVAYPIIERLFDNQQTCQLTQVYLVRPTDSSIFIAKNNSFHELVKIGFAKLRELGMRNRLVKLWGARPPVCQNDILVIDPVTIYVVSIAFILLISGFFLALMIFNCEVLMSSKVIGKFLIRKNSSSVQNIKAICLIVSALKKQHPTLMTKTLPTNTK